MIDVFIDTNIFISFLTKDENCSSATTFFEAIEEKKVQPITSDTVVNEVLFKVMIFELFEKGARNVHDAKKLYIKGDDIRALSDTFFFIKELLNDGLIIRNYPPTEDNIAALEELMGIYRLFPTDALIVATCKYYGIDKIATFDSDFERVDFLKVLKEI